jgi:GNAT superfamily N-acetyltransferase
MKMTYILPLPESTYRLPNVAIADVSNFDEQIPGAHTIHRISVPVSWRGQGYGSKLLKMITDDADREKVILSLAILPSGGLNYEQLQAWYERNGFVGYPQETTGYTIFYRKPRES